MRLGTPQYAILRHSAPISVLLRPHKSTHDYISPHTPRQHFASTSVADRCKCTLRATITNTITVTNTSENHKNTTIATIANHKHVANPLPISRISDKMKALCMRRWRKAEYPPKRFPARECSRISV